MNGTLVRLFGRFASLIVPVTTVLLTSFVTLGADESQPTRLRVVEASPTHARIELVLGHYAIADLSRAGQDYQIVQVDGAELSQLAGAPQLPVVVAALGVAAIAGVEVEILEADVETLSDVRLAPAPTYSSASFPLELDDAVAPAEQYIEDPAIYAEDVFYPQSPVEIASAGMLRDQLVAFVRFTPVQFNPHRREVKVVRRILVEVRWNPALHDAEVMAGATYPEFEQLLAGSLLNYGALTRPPTIRGGGAPPLQNAAPGEASSATPRVKLSVDEDGIYRLGHGDLVAAGWDLSGVDPRKLQLRHRGVELPIIVSGEDDGVFDPGDALFFYGVSVKDIYTVRNAYWLELGGQNGARIQAIDASPGAAPQQTDFPWTVHLEQDTVYWQTMPNGAGKDHWFWGSLLSPSTAGLSVSRTYTVALGHLSPTATTATLRVQLQGYTSLGHRTRLYINNNVVLDASWTGQIVSDHSAAFDHSFLVEGENQLRVETVNVGAVVDQILVNWFELDYGETYVAEEDRLDFRPPVAGAQRYVVSGFSAEDIRVFDVTNHSQPLLLEQTTLTAGEEYSVTLEISRTTAATLTAVAANGYLTPADIETPQPSAWKSPSHGADYILITHEEFMTATQTLAAHRSAQGLRTAVVPVGDLYDEFNDGVFNPSAVRDFLAYAYANWQPPAPLYVLLVGDATLDYKANRWTDTRTFVPTQLIEAGLVGQTATDHWFTTVSGADELPDFYLGRLSVETVAQLETVIQKLIQYDAAPVPGDWRDTLLMVAGDDTPRFTLVSEELVDAAPYYYVADRIYQDAYGDASPAPDIIASVDEGAVMMNYLGHGGVQAWGRTSNQLMLDVDDIGLMANGGRLPLLTIANCMSGYFAGSASVVSVAEAFQRQNDGGAIGILAPTDLGHTTAHQVLLKAFYGAIFQDDLLRVGAAATAAKVMLFGQGVYGPALAQTFVLFGDPYTKLAIPDNVPYVITTTPADQAVVTARDAPIQITFSKPVDPASLQLSGPGVAALNATAAWNTDGTVVTFNHSGFADDSAYTILLQAKDKNGLGLGDGLVPNPWSFTTDLPDPPPPPPSVLNTSPADGAVVQTKFAPIQVTFSKPVVTTTVQVTGPELAALVPLSPAWNVDNTVVTFNHAGFKDDTTYTMTVQAKDEAGLNLAAGVAPNPWSFTTDLPDAPPPSAPPTVIHTSPSDSAIVRTKFAPIQVTFSKPVDPTSVKLVGQRVPDLRLLPTWNGDNTVVTYNHAGFTSGATYLLSMEAEDQQGRSLTDGAVPNPWSFAVDLPALPLYIPFVAKN